MIAVRYAKFDFRASRKKLSSIGLANAALGCLFVLHAPAKAAMCNLPDTGNPVIGAASSSSTTCRVNGLPGVGTDLPGYVLKDSRIADIVVSGGVVGKLYDRVYCLGVGTTCNSTHTYIIATRVEMLSNTSEYFSGFDNVFRNIRGTNSVPIAASVGYWVGSTTTGSDPNTKLAIRDLDYTGKTYKGSGQGSSGAPGSIPDVRDNTKVMFWTRMGAYDSPSSSPWSPWLFVRQNCPFPSSGVDPHYLVQSFSIKYWKDFGLNIQASAYACKTS